LGAAESLAKEGIARRVVSVHTIKPLDEAAVLAAAQTGGLITAEEHSVSGSHAEACAALLLQAGKCVPFKIVDFPDEY
jgi:transketolase